MFLKIKLAIKAFILHRLGFEKSIVETVHLISDYKVAVEIMNRHAPRWMVKDPGLKLVQRVKFMIDHVIGMKKELLETQEKYGKAYTEIGVLNDAVEKLYHLLSITHVPDTSEVRDGIFLKTTRLEQSKYVEVLKLAEKISKQKSSVESELRQCVADVEAFFANSHDCPDSCGEHTLAIIRPVMKKTVSV